MTVTKEEAKEVKKWNEGRILDGNREKRQDLNEPMDDALQSSSSDALQSITTHSPYFYLLPWAFRTLKGEQLFGLTHTDISLCLLWYVDRLHNLLKL